MRESSRWPLCKGLPIWWSCTCPVSFFCLCLGTCRDPRGVAVPSFFFARRSWRGCHRRRGPSSGVCWMWSEAAESHPCLYVSLFLFFSVLRLLSCVFASRALHTHTHSFHLLSLCSTLFPRQQVQGLQLLCHRSWLAQRAPGSQERIASASRAQ